MPEHPNRAGDQMKKIDAATIEALRQHAQDHPEHTYAQLAATFGLTEITVKRYCADLGRGKNWRRGKKQVKANEDRFWASVDRSRQGCWQWKGCRNDAGYGYVHFDGRSEAAHRVAYMLKHGAIPEGMELDHKCRNRVCCNPDHLEAVTHAENMERVRLTQASTGASSQPTSVSRSDPKASIDTTLSARVPRGPDAIPAVVTDGSLPLKGEGSARRSILMAPPPSTHWVSFPASWDQELRAKQAAQDERWGVSDKQIALGRGWLEKMQLFLVTTEGEFGNWIIARSENDAKEMVSSITGPGYRQSCELIRRHVDERSDVALSHRWRAEVKEKFEQWKRTVTGKRRVQQVEAEVQERFLAQNQEEAMDRLVSLREDEEEEEQHRLAQLRGKPSTEIRQPRRSQAERWQPNQYETGDFDPKEIED